MERMTVYTEQLITALLNTHHRATATKNVAMLKNCFVPRGQFIGSDDSEHWPVEEYADRLADTESGWDVTECLGRSIYAVGTNKPPSAFFFEIMRHAKYGVMRGSGVVVKEDGDWMIVQYVLSFSVPNKVVDDTNILELLAQTT